MEPTKVVLGVDIGGTNTKFGYVDQGGRCLANASMPTDSHQPPDLFFTRLHENAGILFQTLQETCILVGIGIGAPNANYHRATIEHPPNLDWDYVDVRAGLGKHFQVPVAITNDAKAAAIGEMLFGAARGMKDFIVITLGTGLGSGIVRTARWSMERMDLRAKSGTPSWIRTGESADAEGAGALRPTVPPPACAGQSRNYFAIQPRPANCAPSDPPI